MGIKIYQVFFDDYTKTQLNECYLPYDNSGDEENEYEYGVMRKVYDQGFDNIDYLGVISWKFGHKMNQFKPQNSPCHYDPYRFYNTVWQMKGKYDVFHANPFPRFQKENPWKNSSLCFHPQLSFHTNELSQMFPEIKHWFTQSHDYTTSCYCNYWAGNQKMWDLYMRYAEMIYPYAKTTGGLFPYLMERIFPSVIKSHQNDIKILPCGIR